MKQIIFALSALFFLAGLLFFINSKSAIHEIEGLIAIVVSSVLLSAGCIITKIEKLFKLKH